MGEVSGLFVGDVIYIGLRAVDEFEVDYVDWYEFQEFQLYHRIIRRSVS